jgi:hypothetical protein
VKNLLKPLSILYGVSLLLAATAANADYWNYSYIGNPLNIVETSNAADLHKGGHVTVNFHSSSLLAPNQTFSLLTTPSISNVIVNYFDEGIGGSPEISQTFNAYPGSQLYPFHSYITTGADSHSIIGWEVAKTFLPIVSPHPGLVVTTGFPPGTPFSFKQFCVLDCIGFDRIVDANGASVWGYDQPGTWTVTFVPEPETYLLLLAGLGFLAFASRSRKKSLSA